MGKVAKLRREVAELRAELAELRAELAAEVRTRHLVVDNGAGWPAIELNVEGLIIADGVRSTELRPGEVSVDHDRAGLRVQLTAAADGQYAAVYAMAGDVVEASPDGSQLVALEAWNEWDEEPGGPHAGVSVNSHELPVLVVR